MHKDTLGVALERADNSNHDINDNIPGHTFEGDPFFQGRHFLPSGSVPDSRSNAKDITGVSVANISTPGPTMAAEITVSHAPSQLLAAASSNLIQANGVSTATITASLLDAWQDTVESATNKVTFTITTGNTSGNLIGTNPVNASSGIATITLQSTTTPGTVTIEASSPGLTSSFTSVTLYSSETEVNGTISANTTWSLANSPYIVVGDITVAAGVKLTIEPGVTVKLNDNKDIFVNGGLFADGTPNSIIIFTANSDAPSPGFWGGIQFNESAIDSICILNHVIINYGGDTGLAIDHPIVLDPRANPTITNTILENNRTNGIVIKSGTYSSDIVLDITGLPYMLLGDLALTPGAALQVTPGVTFKMGSSVDLFIRGGFVANGTRKIM